MEWCCLKQGKRRHGWVKKGFSVSPSKTGSDLCRPSLSALLLVEEVWGKVGFSRASSGLPSSGQERAVSLPGLCTYSLCWLRDLRNHPTSLSLSLVPNEGYSHPPYGTQVRRDELMKAKTLAQHLDVCLSPSAERQWGSEMRL